MKRSKTARIIAALCLAAALLWAQAAMAVTRAEMLTSLYDALGYPPASEMKLPPDVGIDHPHAKRLGHAAKLGLIPLDGPFWPDDEINRHEAIRLTLEMMGWGHVLSLLDSLSSLPDFGGSGDDTLFLAAEMEPKAPEALLVDGATPLSETARFSLCSWASECASGVKWNRVFKYGGTELVLYRQGVAKFTKSASDDSSLGAPPLSEPLFISAVAVDPGAIDTRIAFSAPFSRDRVVPSDFSSSYDALAVVNGGFFHGGRPIGTMLLNGVHAGRPIMGRGAVGWDNASGMIVFGRGGARVGAKAGRAFAEIRSFNVPPERDEASLYTSEITRSTIGAAQDSLYVIASGGRVIEVRTGGDIWIPEGSIALVARGRAAAPFASVSAGDEFSIESVWETHSFASCTDLIQGAPMLLRNGAMLEDDEGLKADITHKRHPRTIVGTDGRRMIWAVIDGRSAVRSRGTTIAETRHIARSLGMTTALNLDGGGSSQMIWRGVMTNVPSDGRERPLPYALLMLPRGSEMAWKPPASDGAMGSWGWGSQEGAEYGDVYTPQPDEGSTEADPFSKLYDEMFGGRDK